MSSGVNEYPGITVGGVGGQKNLTGAVFDAQTFVTLLKTQFHVAGDDIHLLLDTQASHDAILREFETFLIDGSAPGDRVFFYFAGHGSAIRIIDPDTGVSRLTSSIVPADASGELTRQPPDVKGLILGIQIRRLLDRIRDRTVMVVSDSCQSGSISRGIGQGLVVPPNLRVRTLTPAGAIGMTRQAFEADTTMRREAKANGRILSIEPAPSPPSGATSVSEVQTSAPGSLSVWSAATTDQVTFDLVDRPGGVFTQSFADGLRDKKADTSGGTVTAGALLNFVRDQAKGFCKSAGAACSAGLTPQLVSSPIYLTEPIVELPIVKLDGSVSGHIVASSSSETSGQVTADKLTSLLRHTNDFDLHVDVLPGTVIPLGEKIQFKITSAQSGKVAVFDESPDGSLTQLFPNRRTDRIGTIRAHTPLTIPDAFWGVQFTARPPTGAGSLLVLVGEDGMDLGKATSGSLDFKPLVQTSRLLQVIAAEVQKPVVSPTLDEPTREARWAFARIPYRIVDR